MIALLTILKVLLAGTLAACIGVPFFCWIDKGKKEMQEDEDESGIE